MKFILALVFVILNLNSYAQAEYTNDELMNMNLQSLRADFEEDKAYSTGTGRIINDAPNAMALARRAALSDAQRGLLILRRGLKEGRPVRPDDVSGHVPPVKILSEEESGDIYIVAVETVLSELMKDSKEVHEEKYIREEDEEEDEEEHEDIEYEYEDENDNKDFPDVGSLHDDFDAVRITGRDSFEGETVRQ